MSALPARKPVAVKDELTVINNLAGEVQVNMYRGICTLDLTKNKPPVIITLMPGMSRQKFDELTRLDIARTADPIRRPRLGAR